MTDKGVDFVNIKCNKCGNIQPIDPYSIYTSCSECNAMIHRDNIATDEISQPEDLPEPKQASIFTKAKNFTKAVIKHTYNGLGHTSKEEQDKRLDICKSCPLLVANLPMPECGKCGCPVEQKVKWPLEECPEGKWGKEKPRKTTRSTGCSSCQKGKK